MKPVFMNSVENTRASRECHKLGDVVLSGDYVLYGSGVPRQKIRENRKKKRKEKKREATINTHSMSITNF